MVLPCLYLIGWFVTSIFTAAATVGTHAAQSAAIVPMDPNEEYYMAVQKASDTSAALEAHVKDLHDIASNETLIKALGANMLKAAGSKIPTREDIQHVHAEYHQKKRDIAALRATATKAAKDALHWAHKAETAGRHAGGPEHGPDGYEHLFGPREHYSEHLQDHIEHMGEDGEGFAEHIYEKIEEQFEHTREHSEELAQKQTEKGLGVPKTASADVHSISLASFADASKPAATDPELEYQMALQKAHDASAALEAQVQDLHDSHGACIEALGAGILNASGSKIPTREDIRHIHSEYHQKKRDIVALRAFAEKAAKDALHWAHKAETAARHAGDPEHGPDGFEHLFGPREHYSEQLQDHIEHLGEDGEGFAEHIDHKVEGQLKQARKEAEDAAKKRTEQSLGAKQTPSKNIRADMQLIKLPSDADAKKIAAKDTEQEYQKAVQHARDTSAALETHVKDLHDTASNETRIKALGAHILKAAGRSIPTRDDIRNARAEYRRERHNIATLKITAEKAWRSAARWARKAETAGRHAHDPEHGPHGYEHLYGPREHYTEHSGQHVEHMGEDGERFTERIYDKVEEQFERARDRAEKTPEKRAGQGRAAHHQAEHAHAHAHGAEMKAEPGQSALSTKDEKKGLPIFLSAFERHVDSSAVLMVASFVLCASLGTIAAVMRNGLRSSHGSEGDTTYLRLA